MHFDGGHRDGHGSFGVNLEVFSQGHWHHVLDEGCYLGLGGSDNFSGAARCLRAFIVVCEYLCMGEWDMWYNNVARFSPTRLCLKGFLLILCQWFPSLPPPARVP